MATQPDTPRDLDRTGGRQRTNGARSLLLSGVLFAIGMALLAADVDGLGAIFSVVAFMPLVVGLGLFGAGVVSSRAARGKPFV